ncbi:MAG TPA: hypothetical protein ENN22_10245 [bacterium]|nr:hypothetical protein [bacterium]
MQEQNDHNAETRINQTPKKRLAIFRSRKFLILSGVFIALLIIEFRFDVVEIFFGNILEMTNSFRPRAGTIWEREKKDQLANSQLHIISQSVIEPKIETTNIQTLSQLRDLLEEKQSVFLTADQFKNLYNQIPPRVSFDVISPFDLLKLSHSRKWTWTKILKEEKNLSCFFLDGDKQLLMDTYPPLSVLFNSGDGGDNYHTSLDSMEMFQGRSITAEHFFSVFDDFSNAVKLQLINNPYLLIKWDNNIRRIAISQYSTDNTVLIGFEINQGIYTEVYTFDASELAANYLIARLNEMYPELNFSYPQRKYRGYRYYENY